MYIQICHVDRGYNMSKSKLTKSDLVDLVCDNDEVVELNVSKHQVAIIVSKFIETLKQTKMLMFQQESHHILKLEDIFDLWIKIKSL